MICPRCGEINPDSAGECSRCHHKFRLGHAFNDPAHATYPSFTRESSENDGISKRKKIAGYIIFILLLLPLILAIISYFVDF
ncbi:hypothetical protein ACFL6H_00885 [Candidatus Latescibacterota bacterium]